MLTIEERVARLERLNRRLRAALAGAAVVLAAVLSAAWTEEGPADVIRAKRLEIVDGSGAVAVAAGCGVEEGEGGSFGFIEVKNPANAAQIFLSSDTNPDLGARVTVYNESGSEVALLGTGEQAPRGTEHGAALKLRFPERSMFSVVSSEPHARLEMSGPATGFLLECSRDSHTTAKFLRQGIGGRNEFTLVGPGGKSSWRRE